MAKNGKGRSSPMDGLVQKFFEALDRDAAAFAGLDRGVSKRDFENASHALDDALYDLRIARRAQAIEARKRQHIRNIRGKKGANQVVVSTAR